MAKEVWRLVDSQAIRCTDCNKNKTMLGGPDLCLAEDEICIFMKKRIDSQRTWESFHDAYHALNEMKMADDGGEAL